MERKTEEDVVMRTMKMEVGGHRSIGSHWSTDYVIPKVMSAERKIPNKSGEHVEC